MNCEAYQDLVAAHVDGLLSPAERKEVEQHLTSCASCQRLFEEGSRFHAAFATHRLIVSVPAEVEQRLRVALAAENVPILSWWKRLSVFLPQPRLAIGLAVVGLLIVLLIARLFFFALEPTWVTQAVNAYQEAMEGRLSLAYQTSDPEELKRAFNDSGQLDFITHVLDLRSSGYRIEGGLVMQVKDRPIALVLYKGKDGPLICLRQRGLTPPMPKGVENIEGVSLYTHAGYTISLAQFPDHFCMLITRLPLEDFRRRLLVARGF